MSRPLLLASSYSWSFTPWDRMMMVPLSISSSPSLTNTLESSSLSTTWGLCMMGPNVYMSDAFSEAVFSASFIALLTPKQKPADLATSISNLQPLLDMTEYLFQDAFDIKLGSVYEDGVVGPFQRRGLALGVAPVPFVEFPCHLYRVCLAFSLDLDVPPQRPHMGPCVEEELYIRAGQHNGADVAALHDHRAGCGERPLVAYEGFPHGSFLRYQGGESACLRGTDPVRIIPVVYRDASRGDFIFYFNSCTKIFKCLFVFNIYAAVVDREGQRPVHRPG